MIKFRNPSKSAIYKRVKRLPFKLCVQYWAWISHTLVVWSLLPVASSVDVASKHMNWMGAMWMAFQVRVHRDVPFLLARSLNSCSCSLMDASSLLSQLRQLSHCFRRRLRCAVTTCLSSGEMATQVTSSSSYQRDRYSVTGYYRDQVGYFLPIIFINPTSNFHKSYQ